VHGELEVTSPECNVNPNGMRSAIASTIGGVMTKEVGAVTGDLDVATRPKRGASRAGGSYRARSVCSQRVGVGCAPRLCREKKST
jgi:hypothetical protein